MYKVYSVIRSHILGLTNNKIYALKRIHPNTIAIYVNNYYKYGIDGLVMKYDNCGYERNLSSSQEKELLDIIRNHTPNKVGFLNKSNWIISLVRDYIKNTYDASFCISSTYVVMKRLGIRHTRPT